MQNSLFCTTGPAQQADTNYPVRFAAPEFTSICPVTGT
jgi:NADPH-dependent 7-cyano-7-deazaguanine reductase QueF